MKGAQGPSIQQQLDVLQRLHGDPQRAARHNFDSLPHDRKLVAIRELARSGVSPYDIAIATRLSVDAVLQILKDANA